ncbi:MAG: SDR family NAD(P)-dependent oxidoreductase [Actinomycetota bacterium]|jgi:NAD(P)-dependent dehydrogenase (short-subunit alcohol dehydrogenase family)|nr:SDR family NAD(P)-dependent oxidoreductase [Actinomycetota bacterium]
MPPPAPGSRTVLVTGASSGIGRETAVRFARAGDRVVGVARHAPALDELAGQEPGIEAELCDLTRADERAALVERVLARHGRVDVLVNNAGVGAAGLLAELTAEDVERVYATNVVAVADLTRLVLPSMLARGSGVVVVLSSVAAWVSTPPATVYASSKFAVDGLVEGLRRETRGTGVLVHSVNPGPIATPYLARVAERSPQPGAPEVPDAPGFPAAWVADAVVEVAAARHPVTRSVPRVAGLARLAQVPPVGFVLDVALGRLAVPMARQLRRMVAERALPLPRR